MLKARAVRFDWAKIGIHTFFILLSLVFIVPLWAIAAISLSSETKLVKAGYSLIPRPLDFTAYQYILKNPLVILDSYRVTAVMSFAGALLSLLLIATCAYALARKDFAYRKAITYFLFFTMLFNGGLVPYYILMTKYFHVQNTYAGLILPVLGGVFYVFLMRTFFSQLPESIVESAIIDGAGEARIFFSIIIPLSKPVLATVGLIKLLTYWNSWFQALLFISDKEKYPLQYLLQVMLQNIEEITKQMNYMPTDYEALSAMPTESVRMAMAVLAVGPMLFVFPFFQSYFAKGLTVGAVKE
ncbi:carbohydrate ABC transporter permease [Cohnella fermenti]|uniref:Carbohydrate ABC transporter permease n=1 Tax=Cohnella fermenti TaxID=2565925 RepID=A0A4S4C4N3_9BACL|nr:carbohydrate ABC transporter permease [Cohnella fermenti]THF82704.1 carbohydrate ABC transporter permease [Cohnella fermenti]